LIEVVFTASAVKVRRPLVSVDPDHVVAFSPPSSLKVGDTEVAADILATSFGLKNGVVVFPSRFFLVHNVSFGCVHSDFVTPAAEGILTMKFRVEITFSFQPFF